MSRSKTLRRPAGVIGAAPLSSETHAIAEPSADVPLFPKAFSLTNRVARAIWQLSWLLLFRATPVPLHFWRRFLLRLFGAEMAPGSKVYPSARIWAPWHLSMHEHSCIGPYVDCYNCAPIELGAYSVVSQYSYLCTGTHDYTSLALPLITNPIVLGRRSWVCADVFVGPGVRIGEGAVVGARSSVFKNVPEWCVVAGNPARVLKPREIAGDAGELEGVE